MVTAFTTHEYDRSKNKFFFKIQFMDGSVTLIYSDDERYLNEWKRFYF